VSSFDGGRRRKRPVQSGRAKISWTLKYETDNNAKEDPVIGTVQDASGNVVTFDLDRTDDGKSWCATVRAPGSAPQRLVSGVGRQRAYQTIKDFHHWDSDPTTNQSRAAVSRRTGDPARQLRSTPVGQRRGPTRTAATTMGTSQDASKPEPEFIPSCSPISKFKTGHFSLSPILDFAARTPNLPNHISGNTDYRTLIKDVVADVPRLPGWYLWGRFIEPNVWETVYLGKTGKLKTSSLRARIYEELLDECIAFWAAVYGAEPMFAQAHTIYSGKYDTQIRRSARKSGARIIAWIGVEDEIGEQEIVRQESFLIKSYAPTHNIMRGSHNGPHDDLTEQIKNRIDRELSKINVL
jgi:hypothetical protein